AASGVATDFLADQRADELAIVGTGKQALTQIAAVHVVRPLRRVAVYGRQPDRRRSAAERMRSELGLNVVEANSVAEAVSGASSDDLTLIKSLGMGVSDLSLAIEIYREARRVGAGRPIEAPKRAMPRLAQSSTSEVTD